MAWRDPVLPASACSGEVPTGVGTAAPSPGGRLGVELAGSGGWAAAAGVVTKFAVAAVVVGLN